MLKGRRLEGKVALITGGASGIGEETVKLFLENGARVVIADVVEDHEVVTKTDNDDVMNYCRCDVRDEKQVEEAVKHTLAVYGRLDIVFSNAGILGPMTGLLEMDLDEFDNTMAINIRGAAAIIKHGGRAMVASGIKGSIICTGSVASSMGGAGPHAYTISKHAMVGLMRTACHELGSHGIRVNCVSPYGVATPLSCNAYNLQPSQLEDNCSRAGNLKGIVLKPKHVAEAALFLASDESAYVSGQNLGVDGGFTVVTHTYDDSTSANSPPNLIQ